MPNVGQIGLAVEATKAERGAHPLRIAMIYDNLGPYHIARLNALSRECDLLAIEVRTLSMEYSWAREETGSFRRTTLLETPGGSGERRRLREGIERSFQEFNPEVLFVPGWYSVAAAIGLLTARVRGTPAVVMSDSQERDFKRTAIKEWIKRLYVKNCQAGLVAGDAHARYLTRLGMDSSLIWTGYDVVDNCFFRHGSNRVKRDPRYNRRRRSLPERYFFCCARLIEKKNLLGLIDEYSVYVDQVSAASSRDRCWHLVLAGDGPLQQEITAHLKERQVSDLVHMVGFIAYQEIPAYYGLASAFILPSITEQWGLVVNEAMASGLAVIVSDRCGCVPDIVKDGRNGFSFDPFVRGKMSELMKRISSSEIDLDKMASESAVIISEWSLSRFVKSSICAANAALLDSSRIGALDRLLLRLLATGIRSD